MLSHERLAKECLANLDKQLLKIADENGFFAKPGGEVERRAKQAPQLRLSGNDKRDGTGNVRFYSFAKPLRSLEARFGLSDMGRTFIGFVLDVTFTEMVGKCEVWKDSISRNHGEYTHRLQWMMIVGMLNLTKDVTQALYTNSVKVSAFPMKDNSGKDRATTTLWDFLVDCFSIDGATLFTQNAKTGDADGVDNVGPNDKGVRDVVFTSPLAGKDAEAIDARGAVFVFNGTAV